MKKTIFDAEGAFLRTITLTGDPVADALLIDIPEGGGMIDGEFDSAITYFPGGVATQRPTMDIVTYQEIAADGVDSVVLDVPEGTRIFDDRGARVVGTFVTRVEGVHVLTVMPPFPIRPETVTIRAIGTASHDTARAIEAIVAERSRRLAAGFDYHFQDARGVHRIGTSDDDLKGWDEVTKLAAPLINTGQGETEIIITTETGPVAVTANEWQHILITAGAFRQPIWQASFLLQTMDPMPQDVTSDQYWP